MKKTMKWIGWALLVALVVGGIVVWRIWNKPHRDVTEETATDITATALVDSFVNNETSANARYLDKAMVVTGKIIETGLVQDSSQQTITLQSNNMMTSVFCTLRKGENTQAATGDEIKVRGICKGILSDVLVTDAVIEKQTTR
jgi:hypothetical protein